MERATSMPLPLDDSRWSTLQGSYGGTAKVVAWLYEAYEAGSPADDLLGDIINEVQHQSDTSTAMYPVAMHLIALARTASPTSALNLLLSAGITYADSGRRDALELACESLRRAPLDRDDSWVLIETVAALHGHPNLALLLQAGPDLCCPQCGEEIAF